MTSNQRTTLLRCILYGFGVLAFVFFCVTKSPRAMERATAGSYRYGDLYHFAKIRRFKPSRPLRSDEIPPRPDSVLSHDDGAPSIRTFLFGDSFSWVRCEETTFADELGKNLGSPLYCVSKHQHDWYYQNPLLFFSEHPIETNEQRILILEMVERYISKAFALPPALPPIKTHNTSTPKEVSWLAQLESISGRYVRGNERDHQFLLKNSFLTRPLVEEWNSLVFEVFRKTPEEVPVYSLRPPMLFFNEETDPKLVTSFYARHDDELIARLSEHITMLASELERRHHFRLVFVPIPNKFTVYSRLVTRDVYDEFIPRLIDALQQRGVAAVNLLPTFRGRSEMLYYVTDTHWNARGMKLAVPLVARGCTLEGSFLEPSGAPSEQRLLTGE
jgi:hypothetical protein